jgi:diguanylate cyclase (GGDEF)-like protein
MLNTNDKFQYSDVFSVDNVELKGFSRSIAELEWLLLVLVILYLVTPGTVIEDEWLILKACLAFGSIVLAFRFLNFYRHEALWKLIVQIWLMILFITYVLYFTGKIESPLLNLYLLVIITSGLTLGKFHTLLILATITVVYMYMGVPDYNFNTLSLKNIGVMMTVFSPYLLIAYLTTMLSADLHYAKKMFKLLSETDDMTGLENLRSFNQTLTSEIKTASRYKHVFSVLMIDADGLKAINDSHGHEAGNTLIKTVANSIQSCLRESDKLARYGGDEFIALLPETDCEAALEVGERIRKGVENTSFDMKGNKIKTTVSIGIASYPAHASEGDELMHKADRALYQSKEAGRNKVLAHAATETNEQKSNVES